MSKLEMFSEARIAFEKEIRTNHPKIAMKMILANAELGEVADEGTNIGVAAAEFNIVMDGAYSRDQIEAMYNTLFHKLREKSKESIIHVPSKVLLPPGIVRIH